MGELGSVRRRRGRPKAQQGAWLGQPSERVAGRWIGNMGTLDSKDWFGTLTGQGKQMGLFPQLTQASLTTDFSPLWKPGMGITKESSHFNSM